MTAVSEQGYIEVAVAAVPGVTPAELNEEDRLVPGVYSVMVQKHLLPARMAAAALDRFHSTVPVGELEDFSFFVFDPQSGLVLEEDPAREGYADTDLAKDCLRIGDEPPQMFSVQVSAVCQNGEAQVLGTVAVAAPDPVVAHRLGFEALWAADLADRGCYPDTKVNSLS